MCQRDRVRTEIEQWSACELGIVDAVIGGEELAVVGDDRTHLTEHAIVQQLADDIELRQELRPHRLAREAVGVGGRGGDVPRAPGVHCERLLDQHVLARVQCVECVVAVARVRRRDVDDVDVRIVEERFIAVVRLGQRPLRGERRCPALVA